MTQRFCRVCGGWHHVDAWPHNCLPERNLAQSDLPAPNVISDVMSAVQSQATGVMYDSKSKIRAEYKRLGMVEVGNDPARLRPRQRPQADRKAIRASIEKATARFNRGERVKPQ